MTIILAVDPGEKACGYAAVAIEGPKVRFVDAGDFEAELGAFAHVLDRLTVSGLERDLVVAVEQPAGFIHDPFRGPALLATASCAGGVAWVAESRGLTVVRLAATEVRRMLLGKTRLGSKSQKGDMDRMIAMVLPGVVVDMPKRSNVHVRDALALAVAASWTLAQGRKSA